MDKIIYRLVYNRKKVLNRRGLALIQVEAYQNRKKKYFSTKVYLRPDQWDHKKNLIKNHPNAKALNHLIYAYMAEIEERELWLWQQGKVPTLGILKEALRVPKENSISFLAFLKEEITNSSLKESTKINHLSTYELLKGYKKGITFQELTFEFVSSFELYLRNKGYHTNTIAKHMKHLKRYINVAINKEHIEIQQYAFRKYKIKSVENNHTHLDPSELQALEALDLKGRHTRLSKTLDAFLFCCYLGIRYSDFSNLTPANLIEVDGNTWLVFRTIKTSTEVRLPLNLLFDGKALKMLAKHKSNLPDFFNLRDNSNVNKELLIIARLAGLSKRISFHTARHTNATLLIYSGVNITTVQKLLGHKSIKTTQVYTNVMDMTIVNDLATHVRSSGNA